MKSSVDGRGEPAAVVDIIEKVFAGCGGFEAAASSGFHMAIEKGHVDRIAMAERPVGYFAQPSVGWPSVPTSTPFGIFWKTVFFSCLTDHHLARRIGDGVELAVGRIVTCGVRPGGGGAIVALSVVYFLAGTVDHSRAMRATVVDHAGGNLGILLLVQNPRPADPEIAVWIAVRSAQ